MNESPVYKKEIFPSMPKWPIFTFQIGHFGAILGLSEKLCRAISLSQANNFIYKSDAYGPYGMGYSEN